MWWHLSIELACLHGSDGVPTAVPSTAYCHESILWPPETDAICMPVAVLYHVGTVLGNTILMVIMNIEMERQNDEGKWKNSKELGMLGFVQHKCNQLLRFEPESAVLVSQCFVN